MNLNTSLPYAAQTRNSICKQLIWVLLLFSSSTITKNCYSRRIRRHILLATLHSFWGNCQQNFSSEDDYVCESLLTNSYFWYTLIIKRHFWKLKNLSKHFINKPEDTLYTSQMKSVFTFSLTPSCISNAVGFICSIFSMTISNSQACFGKLKPD